MVLKSDLFGERVFEFGLGTNRLGRDPSCEFPVEHATVSWLHCEFWLTGERVMVRDCDSSNGTFLDGQRVKESALRTGQTLRVGEVELFVESASITVAIPYIETGPQFHAIISDDGAFICPRHSGARAVFQCSHCRQILCRACVHEVRRQGGKGLLLCSLCGRGVEPLEVLKEQGAGGRITGWLAKLKPRRNQGK